MFHIRKISWALCTLGLSAPSFAAGLHQILGPYTASMSHLEFESSSPDPFHVIIDHHEVFGCRIDKYYQQSTLNDQLFYVEVHDDPMGNNDCLAPKKIIAGSVIKVDPKAKAGKNNRKTLLINNYSASPSDSINFEFDSIKITANDTKDFWFYRIYDSEGTAFSAKVLIPSISDTGDCLQGTYSTYPLDFSFYQDGELIESDSRIITRANNTSPAAPAFGASCPDHTVTTLTWGDSPDPYPFRKMVIYIEKRPGTSKPPKVTVLP